MKRLGLLLAVFGIQIGASWAPLAASWAPLGASWAQLGRSWVPLGLNLEPLGSLWESTWPFQLASKRHFGFKCPLIGLRVPSECSPSGLQVNFNLHTHLTFELSLALPFELPQQLPVPTKLHLNFHNSFQCQLYTIASAHIVSALHSRWISTGAG